jgi:hypothetical protein
LIISQIRPTNKSSQHWSFLFFAKHIVVPFKNVNEEEGVTRQTKAELELVEDPTAHGLRWQCLP